MASSSSLTNVRKYDVFLSFRGDDTRNTVVSYLYQDLCRKGIFTFKDDQGFQTGDRISDQLIQAIETSWFAVVVISEKYATSKWCLEELRLIMELHRQNRIQVVPIFYRVQPTDVRHQTGSFAAAFQEYEEQGTAPERVSQWRRALNEVSHLSGIDSSTRPDDAGMISETVRTISSQLLEMRQPRGVDLVGMEAHMVKTQFLLNMGSENEVIMIGIWGMGGVGKTAIAQCLYDRLSRQFPAHYFIRDIKMVYKDKSTSHLQESFLSTILPGQFIGFLSDEARSTEIKARLGHQKVLVVLDGVDKAEQVRALAKETSWFGPGSRIIITTRDKGLLNSCGVHDVYKVDCLNNEDALQVFEKFAFGGRPPPSDGFEQLFIRAARLTHGLPSALVAYASHLSENTTTERWEDELRLLETRPHKNVEEILRNSYDILDEQDKTAFLQIACLFNGYSFRHLTSLLDHGHPRMQHLITKSLISISTRGCIDVHFLVIQTGRAIVCKESRNRPSRQRFLWDHTEIYDILDNNIGTYKTEGVTLHMCEMTDDLPLSNTVFSVMHGIKFFNFYKHWCNVESINFLEIWANEKVTVQLMKDGIVFPPNLRLLHWDDCPLKTLGLLRQRHLVQLDLRYNKLEWLWGRDENFQSLRRLDVSGSINLIELPDFSTARNLEELIVDGCANLGHIPESLRRLDHLKKLNAISCSILRETTFTVRVTSHIIHWTTKLEIVDFMEVSFNSLTDLSIEGKMYIEVLDLNGSAEHLSFGSKHQIPNEMMSHFNSPQSLEIARFNYVASGDPFECPSFHRFPCLIELKLINLNIHEIPQDIDHLQSLEKLDLSGNDFMDLPTSMRHMARLKHIRLRNCSSLSRVPLLTQVEILVHSDSGRFMLIAINYATEPHETHCLLELWINNCSIADQSLSTTFLPRFSKLAYLNLSGNLFASVPESIRELSSLKTLFLDNCKKLVSVEELPESINYLYAHGCDSLERVSLSPNHSIKQLDLKHCPRLNREEQRHLMNLFREESARECVCY